VGSNPTLSATNIFDFGFWIFDLRSEQHQSKIKTQKSKILWRGAGVAELAALEML